MKRRHRTDLLYFLLCISIMASLIFLIWACCAYSQQETIDINGKSFIVIKKITENFKIIQDPETGKYYSKGLHESSIGELPRYELDDND